MSAAKKDLIDMQKDFAMDDIDQTALAEIKKLVPLEFNIDKRGNLSSRYQETTVFVDNEHQGAIKPGEMWIVSLKSGTSYYYAIPKFEVNEAFIAAVLKEDNCELFIDRIFDPKKGIKPRYAQSLKEVMDVLAESALQKLAESETRCKEAEDKTEHIEKQLKTTIEKNIALQKKSEEEKSRLQEQIKELKVSTDKECVRQDRRQIDALSRRCTELEREKNELENKLQDAVGTNKSLKQSYEESLAKAQTDVETANRQRDAVAKAKEKAIAEYEAKIAQMASESKDTIKNSVKGQVKNLNEMIDQLQLQLSGEVERNRILKDDFDTMVSEYRELETQKVALEKQNEELNAVKSDDSSNATILALQNERKVFQNEIQKITQENEVLQKANNHLSDEIRELIAKLNDSDRYVDASTQAKDLKVWSKPPFRVKRVSKLGIESDWFTAEKYCVLTTKTENQLLIRPDEHGYVSCKDFVLEIAGLDRMQPFTKSKTLEVLQDTETMEIKVTL